MEPSRFFARFMQHPICVLLGLLVFVAVVDARFELRTVYDVLRANGLPIGLLPKGVNDFTIDDESGMFQVRLDQACNAKFESEVHYDTNVSGILSYGMISNLTGVEAKELFLWFPVKSIHVDIPSTGLIYFDVSVVFKQFSLSLFDTPPDCVACASPDPQLVSVSKRRIGILHQRVPGEHTVIADI